MKAILKLVPILLLILPPRSADASVVVLDSFSEGGFAVSNVFDAPLISFGPGGTVETRYTFWRGTATSSYMTQTSGSGILNLRLSLRGDPPVNNPAVFSLMYINSSSAIDLIGLSHAIIRVTSFTGTGGLRLYLNGGPEPTPITLSGPGDYLLPIPVFTGEAAEIPVTRLTIDFLGRSADFAVTLDEITLIPEPSCSGLLLAGGLLVAGMRGRHRTTVQVTKQITRKPP